MRSTRKCCAYGDVKPSTEGGVRLSDDLIPPRGRLINDTAALWVACPESACLGVSKGGAQEGGSRPDVGRDRVTHSVLRSSRSLYPSSPWASEHHSTSARRDPLARGMAVTDVPQRTFWKHGAACPCRSEFVLRQETLGHQDVNNPSVRTGSGVGKGSATSPKPEALAASVASPRTGSHHTFPVGPTGRGDPGDRPRERAASRERHSAGFRGQALLERRGAASAPLISAGLAFPGARAPLVLEPCPPGTKPAFPVVY